MLLAFILLSYVLGSIPFGYLIGKIKKVDVRKMGSGNIGATNVNRVLGFKIAIIVGLCDFLKGLAPVLLALTFFTNPFSITLIALATICGHIFSIFLKFKGGKGVATYGGAILAILGIKIFIILAIIWLTFLYISKLMSLTNLVFSLLIPFLFYIFGSTIYFIFSLITALLLWYTHRENIDRLTKGTEHKLNFKKIIP
jgi:glycerol-3-phosphate acyltransferase PlsY